jgi:hypothetical protein
VERKGGKEVRSEKRENAGRNPSKALRPQTRERSAATKRDTVAWDGTSDLTQGAGMSATLDEFDVRDAAGIWGYLLVLQTAAAVRRVAEDVASLSDVLTRDERILRRAESAVNVVLHFHSVYESVWRGRKTAGLAEAAQYAADPDDSRFIGTLGSRRKWVCEH